MMIDYPEQHKRLERRLGYRFTDRAWLMRALTHRSKSRTNYERLEFLGDALLDFVISDCLYRRFPGQPEGVLTRLRANLVRRPSLAGIARELDLGEFLILGAGENKSGGHQRDSTLSDVFEAIIAAIYLDGGIDSARLFIEAIFSDRIGMLNPDELLKDPKSALQEWLQQHQQELPDYRVIEVSGKEHKQVFDVQCRVGSEMVFSGKAGSRRSAEQKAAAKALAYLKTQDNG